MAYIELVMPIKDFIEYIKEDIQKLGVYMYIEQKEKNGLQKQKIDLNQSIDDLEINGENYSRIYITSKNLDCNINFYGDDNFHFVIDGTGGRTNDKYVELISLRIVSKTPDASIKKIFNRIRNKLKKDSEIGVGLKAGIHTYKNFFYSNKSIGNRKITFNFNHIKDHLIEFL